MAGFHPKEVLEKARQAEQAGETKAAAMAYASLSAYLRKRGKHEQSIKLIKKAIRLAPKLIRLRLHEALSLEVSGDSSAADSAMEEFTSLAVSKGKVEHYRGVVESVLKDHPRLRQIFFDGVLQLDRTGAEAYLGRARSLLQQNKVEDAVEVLLDALQGKMGTEEVLAELESALRTAGKSDRLIHLGRFRDGKIDLDNILLLLRAREPGLISIKEEDFEIVEKPLRNLIEELEKEIGVLVEDPAAEIAPLLNEFRRRSEAVLAGDARAHMDMGIAYFEMGLHAEASHQLQKISETESLFPEAQVLLGDIALVNGNSLAALDAFQNSLRSPQRSEEVERESRYKLVQVYLRLGDLRKALLQAEELENLAPEYRDLRQLKVRIEDAVGKKEAEKS